MKEPRVEPQNAFSERVKLSPLVSEAVLTLCRLSDQLSRPVALELSDEEGTYAITVAVASDPAKVAQLIALAKSWER